ncbi:hypothetical protein BDV18DRAFT_143136 [Aspergillus unguis]
MVLASKDASPVPLHPDGQPPPSDHHVERPLQRCDGQNLEPPRRCLLLNLPIRPRRRAAQLPRMGRRSYLGGNSPSRLPRLFSSLAIHRVKSKALHPRNHLSHRIPGRQPRPLCRHRPGVQSRLLLGHGSRLGYPVLCRTGHIHRILHRHGQRAGRTGWKARRHL